MLIMEVKGLVLLVLFGTVYSSPAQHRRDAIEDVDIPLVGPRGPDDLSVDLGSDPLSLLEGIGDVILQSLQNFTMFISNTTQGPVVTTDQTSSETMSTQENLDNNRVPDLCSSEDSEQANCAENAVCLLEPTDTRGYSCACRPGYLDVSPMAHRPGEVCIDLTQEMSSDPQCADYCYNDGVCKLEDGEPKCRCMEQYAGSRCEIPAVVLFVVFSSVLAALSVVILAIACVYQVKRFMRRHHNSRRHLIDEDDEDNSTIVYKRTDFISTLSPPKV